MRHNIIISRAQPFTHSHTHTNTNTAYAESGLEAPQTRVRCRSQGRWLLLGGSNGHCDGRFQQEEEKQGEEEEEGSPLDSRWTQKVTRFWHMKVVYAGIEQQNSGIEFHC
jgi:hypothetical protein